jgi:hypothetical protein
VLVRPDHGTVENHPFQVGILEGLKDPLPDPFLGPTVEPLPDRAPRAKSFRHVAPGCPGLANPEDGIDEKAVVLGGHAGIAGLSRE